MLHVPVTTQSFLDISLRRTDADVLQPIDGGNAIRKRLTHLV